MSVKPACPVCRDDFTHGRPCPACGPENDLSNLRQRCERPDAGRRFGGHAPESSSATVDVAREMPVRFGPVALYGPESGPLGPWSGCWPQEPNYQESKGGDKADGDEEPEPLDDLDDDDDFYDWEDEDWEDDDYDGDDEEDLENTGL